jgi:hypothetical protein
MEFDDLARKFICFIDDGSGGEGGGAGGGSGEGGGDSGAGDQGGEGGQGDGGAPKAESLTKEGIALLVSEQMKPLHEKIGELTSENVNLRNAMRSGAGVPRRAEPEIVKEEPPKLPTKDEFLAQMNADPVTTIKTIIESIVNPQLDKRITAATSGVKAESEAREAFMRDAEGDRTNALSVASTYEGDLRTEYDKLGDQELRAIAASRGGRYQVGDLELAANRAERKMRQAGKLPNANSNGNGSGNGNNDTRFSFQRNNPKSSSGAGAGNGNGNGAGAPGAIKTIDDLVAHNKMTKDEAEGARKNNKKWGLSDEDFVKSYMEAEKDNPRFGTGA